MNWNTFFQTYWGVYVGAALAFFLAPETSVLVAGHPEWTLSVWTWHHEGFLPNHSPVHWTAAHYFIAALVFVLALYLVSIAVWLVGHLVFEVWQ